MLKQLLVIFGLVVLAQAQLKDSRARQNFKCDEDLNKQIKTEFDASQIYLSIANYFSHDRMALEGFAKMFRHSFHEEMQHGTKLIEYGILRGARVETPLISKPDDSNWSSLTVCQIVEEALRLEKKVNDQLLKFHQCADQSNDPQLQDFIEGEYLNEQVDANKELSDLLTRLERATSHVKPDGKVVFMCDGLGLHQIDQELAKKFN